MDAMDMGHHMAYYACMYYVCMQELNHCTEEGCPWGPDIIIAIAVTAMVLGQLRVCISLAGQPLRKRGWPARLSLHEQSDIVTEISS